MSRGENWREGGRESGRKRRWEREIKSGDNLEEGLFRFQQGK